jgi:hypothetical protein
MSDTDPRKVAERYGATVELLERALGGEADALRQVLTDRGVAVGWDDDVDVFHDGRLMDGAYNDAREEVFAELDDWPLELVPTFTGFDFGPDSLRELTVVVAAGGPHVELVVDGGDWLTVRAAWWSAPVDVRVCAPAVAAYWWELGESLVPTHTERR